MAAPLGNQNAAKCKLVHDELRKLVIQDDGKRLRKGLEKVLTAFEAGEPWAAQFVRDTLDGKPAQSVTVSGDEDTPMLVQAIRMIVVRPDHSDRITELTTRLDEINLLPEKI